MALANLLTACSDTPRDMLSPSNALPPAASAAVVGGGLKASVPASVAPADGAELDTLKPTLVIKPAVGTLVDVTFLYEFQVLDESGSAAVNTSSLVAASGNEVAYQVSSPLNQDTVYGWRARAVFEGVAGAWSEIATFKTRVPSLGASCASADHLFILACVSAKFPERLQSRDNDDLGRRHDMEFLRDRIIEAGLCGGLQFGWNVKANGETSIDFLAWRDRDRSSPHNGPGVHDWGIDVAVDYDNNANPLVLSWRPHGIGANWVQYQPTTACIGG